MVYRKILIDTNICLDVIQNRKPFNYNAHKILDYSEKGLISGFLSSHSFDTIFYILIQNSSRDSVYNAIEGLRRAVDIASVTKNEIDEALKLKWPDFEDAIHHQAAISAGCDAIVTRNPIDFKHSDLPVLTPPELLNRN